MDVTHFALEDGTECEILNVIDDHSRLCVASVAREVTKAIDVVVTFREPAPQTCGKIEGFHQTVKMYLRAQRRPPCSQSREITWLGEEDPRPP
jgi:hypothetical protein